MLSPGEEPDSGGEHMAAVEMLRMGKMFAFIAR